MVARNNTVHVNAAVNDNFIAGGYAENGNTGGLSLFGNAVFNFSGLTAPTLNPPRLTVNGGPDKIEAPGRTADFSGASLSYLAPAAAGPGDTLLTVTGGAVIDAATDVGLACAAGRPQVSLGQGVILLEAAALTNNGFGQATLQAPRRQPLRPAPG